MIPVLATTLYGMTRLLFSISRGRDAASRLEVSSPMRVKSFSCQGGEAGVPLFQRMLRLAINLDAFRRQDYVSVRSSVAKAIRAIIAGWNQMVLNDLSLSALVA